MKFKEMFNDVLPIITSVAPTIGAAIGGPVGAATGYVIPILASAFGVHSTDVKGLVDKIANNGEAQNILASLEREHGDWVNSMMDTVANLSKAEINIKLEWQPEK